jgi:nitroreductase
MAEIIPDGDTPNLRVLAERMRSRRTTNQFLRQKVSKRLVMDAIDLARWAPNHHLTEPWRFYLLGARMIAACARLIGEIAAERKSAEFGEFKRESAAVIPGWLLVTCQKSAEQLRQCEDYASCCCAVQNLMLYLSEAGVATKWTTGHITRDRRLFELLNIDPDEEFVVGLFWYGYPRILPDQSRKPLSEIITVID